ncbi:DNA-binding protein-like protein [Emericellopsis cladophorae]|uniref:DNA-binding protein-like protein n=1 Tax=Emericellopsis cladophorae TaxID=2686198 RepID=A0A9Q0BFZ4_9HYPO|nr:DNA-binding protein-like protein [Emericellopsis cladophorae]KAI6784502.1 DNA-binding protein-like protein [Emericellopsis cladophorae]
MPPLLLTSELNLYLPLRSRLWRAETAWQWQELRQSTPIAEITVHEAFSRLFGRTNEGVPSQLSSLGNYVLIHALLQHVYLLKQTSFSAGSPYDMHRTLKPDDVEEVAQALRVWQTSFEHRHQLRSAESGHFGGTESIPGGSLAYNASALLRLAYIRLYIDLPPGRALETRDWALIASRLSATPLLMRSLRLHRAVYQAVHALSRLVKAGVAYVARAKSSEWSIQNSLCNFECAILLANWLLTLASIGPSDPQASPEEKNLLDTVRRMLDETEFAVPVDPSLSGPGNTGGHMEIANSDNAKLRQLAAAVVRLWAETFKGTHIFDMVKVMGLSLDGYADLIEKPRERTPLGRLAPEAGMN